MIWYEWENVYEYIVGGCCRNHHIQLYLRYTRNPITHTTHTRTLAIAFYPIDVARARAQAFLISSLTLGWFLHRYATTMEKWWFVLSHESKFHRDSITCFINKIASAKKNEKKYPVICEWRICACTVDCETKHIFPASRRAHTHTEYTSARATAVYYIHHSTQPTQQRQANGWTVIKQKNANDRFLNAFIFLFAVIIFSVLCVYIHSCRLCVCVCHRCSLAMATQRSTETRQTKRHSMHQCQSLLCLFRVHHVRINVAPRRSNGWE